MRVSKRGLVYLAGPIRGATYEEAMEWRRRAASWLDMRGIDSVSPMRGKSYLASVPMNEDGSVPSRVLSTPKGITTRDRFDVQRCNVVLANFLGAGDTASLGTCVEFGWADAYRKPVVMVVERTRQSNVHRHAMLTEIAGYVVDTLEEALELVDVVIG